jgi:hypothetical protein
MYADKIDVRANGQPLVVNQGCGHFFSAKAILSGNATPGARAARH